MAGGNLMVPRDRDDEVVERLSEAIGQIRIDLYRPWRYLLFVFFAGVARGIGFALGMTVILAVLAFFLTKALTAMVDFPLVGSYVAEIAELLQAYLKTGTKLR
jgi:hypothetical protein